MADKTIEEQFEDLKGHHAGVMQSLTTLQSRLDAALQKEVDDKEAFRAALKQQVQEHAAALASLREEMQAECGRRIAVLKEQVLVPALKEKQAQQEAAMKAQHAAELASL